MANISTIRPDAIPVPLGYPTTPQPGKIQLLYDKNKHDLYHKLSPYGYDTFLGIKTRQPFFYTYADDKIGTMQEMVSRELPFASSVTDAQRMIKFIGSGPGIIWLGKQFLLQTGNAFNETRLFNPTSPIVAAGMGITFGLLGRPLRHIDISSVSGLVGSILGPTIGSAVGAITGNKDTAPAGTVGLAGLAANNQSAGKGLLRAGTANAAKVTLQNKWDGPSGGKGIGLGSFLSSTIKSLFGNFLPQRQSGVLYRSDENTYELMLGSYSGNDGYFSYQGATAFFDGVMQFWYAGSSQGAGSMRPGGKLPLNHKKIYVGPTRLSLQVPNSNFQIPGIGSVGYDATPTGGPLKYGDFVGKTKKADWVGSDMLIQHSFYVDEGNKYPSKQTDKQADSVVETKNSLQRVIDQLQSSGVYSVKSTPESSVLIFNQAKIGYDRIVGMKKPKDPETNYQYSVLKEYRDNIRVLENQHTNNPKENSLKMASSRQFDGLNTLTVLDGDKSIKKENQKIAGWTNWQPYKDDLIAFYFYDVVNDKYIPFRATIRGLQETDSANWEELSFIGRADRLYSYSGFNRSLSFSFTVCINSIIELAPTWQRINYLMSLVKPSSYTRNSKLQPEADIYTRYMVPPMVMITIGDMYKNQPIVLAGVGLNVPETALWETLNEENSSEWSYLANYIKSPNLGKLYGQLPKTVDLSVNAYVLEKERAIVGAAHFGHSPHTENYIKGQYRNTTPDFQVPSKFHESLVVYNEQKSTPASSGTTPSGGGVTSVDNVSNLA
jgi:hypothetical protein